MNNIQLNDFPALFSGHLPVMPVVTLNNTQLVKPLLETLLSNGISLIEVTLRTPNALRIIETIRSTSSEIVLGAGTLTQTEQFEQVKNAGAQFSVSPGLTPELASAAQTAQLPFMPGIATASEIMQAMHLGYRYLKFFPAEISGGKQFLKAMQGPFPDINFCPTGGINLNNCKDYLNLENVFCIGATWITPQDLIEQQQWIKISDRIQEMKTNI